MLSASCRALNQSMEEGGKRERRRGRLVIFQGALFRTDEDCFHQAKAKQRGSREPRSVAIKFLLFAHGKVWPVLIVIEYAASR